MSKARRSLFIVAALAIVATSAFLLLRPAATEAQKKAGLFPHAGSHDDGIENYDIRTDKNGRNKIAEFRSKAGRPNEMVTAIRDRQLFGARILQQRMPALDVNYDEALHIPEVIGPDVRTSKAFLTRPTTAKRSDALKSFIVDNSNLLGVDPSDVAGLKTVANYTDPNGKLSFVELSQDIQGVPVFQGGVRAGFAKNGEIVRLVNDLAPGLAGAEISSDFGDPVGAARAAASHINVDPDTLNLSVNEGASTDLKQVLGSADFSPTAEKIYFPTEPGVVVPAWRVLIYENARAYYVIVDATTGTMLWRKDLTDDQLQPASYMVYVNSTSMAAPSNSLINAPDSPYPLTPGPADPSIGTQGSAVSRSLITLVGNEPPYTFNQLGWITDGHNTTDGNNAQAGLNRKNQSGTGFVDIDSDGIATGSPSRIFNFASNVGNPGTGTGESPLPTGQSGGTCLASADATQPTAYEQAAVTQLFYLVNRYHDVMYQLGFTEAAHNFQDANFTGQGFGGDRLSAQAQDCSGVENANFTTPADGSRPTMRMYLWPGTNGRAMLDGAFDADVVLHEHTHGLSNRLHGNSTGLVTNMARGMGEGWSDFYARALLAEPTDPVQGIYTVGGYVTSNRFSAQGTTPGGNYYYGIRRYPFDVMSHTGGVNNKPHDAYTFSYVNSDCNARMNTTNFAFPRNPVFGGSTCDEIHNMGEIWASMLWECRAKFIARLGAVAGNQRVLQLITDGMKLAPSGPTFITERDAIIAAAQAAGDPNDVADLWAGFAIRGLGANASIQSIGSGANNTKVTDGFDLPNITQTGDLTVSDAPGNGDGYAEPGETVNVTVPLTNVTGQTATGVTVTIVGGGTTSYGSLTGIQSNGLPIAFTIPANATCGAFLNITINVTSSLGTTSFQRQIFVGKPAAMSPAENFDSVTAPALPTRWTATTELGGINFVSSTMTPDSGTNAMFALDPTTVGGATDLISPMISVTSSTAMVTFRNKFNTEDGWDGGVLEISVNGNDFRDITTVGGSFAQNGYNSTLGGGANNPIAGRPAWTGLSNGYITTIAQLPASTSGKLVQLRWRFGADDNTAGAGSPTGWWVDTISLTGAGFVTSYSCQLSTDNGDPVNIAGRVVNAGGFGIRGARVVMRDAANKVHVTVSNALGYYSFAGVTAGQSVTLNAIYRGYTFSPVTMSVTSSLAQVDIIGNH